MNVIVSNEQKNKLLGLDIDVIKNVSGIYNVQDIIDIFKTFFFSKIIIDVTALNNYNELNVYEQLINGFDPNKIILLLPEGSMLCTPNFLSNLIYLGIYNFTTNIEGIKYLLEKPNSLKDVEHIRKLVNKQTSNNSASNDIPSNENTTINNVGNSIINETSNNMINSNFINTDTNINTNQNNINDNTTTTNTNTNNNNYINSDSGAKIIIGIKNLTEHAGATTFIYMLKKELTRIYGKESTIAIEIEKYDFQIFREPNMLSSKGDNILKIIDKYPDAKFVLVDLNNNNDNKFCTDIIYLLEPSTLKLNKLIINNKYALSKLTSSKIVLNQSLLLSREVYDFEKEVGISVFYNMPPLNDRKSNAIVSDFLTKMRLVVSDQTQNQTQNKIFGLFRR